MWECPKCHATNEETAGYCMKCKSDTKSGTNRNAAVQKKNAEEKSWKGTAIGICVMLAFFAWVCIPSVIAEINGNQKSESVSNEMNSVDESSANPAENEESSGGESSKEEKNDSSSSYSNHHYSYDSSKSDYAVDDNDYDGDVDGDDWKNVLDEYLDDKVGYGYDDDDTYYSNNDYNNDGYINGNEFQGALDDYLSDYGY